MKSNSLSTKVGTVKCLLSRIFPNNTIDENVESAIVGFRTCFVAIYWYE